MPRSKRDTVRDRTASAPSPESPLLSKRKVFAQRKFAQGVATPCAGSAPPSPPAASSRPPSPAPLPPDGPLPKTEDFITFLCFRGTSRLPAHLERFNHPPLPGSSGSRAGRPARSSAAAGHEGSPSRAGSNARAKDQKSANGIRQNGHVKMSATKPLFQKHNSALHSRSARDSPSSVCSSRSEKAAPALKRAQVVLRKLSHSSLIAKKKSQSAKLRAQKAVDKQARMLQRLVVSSSLRYPSSGPAIKLTTLKQQRPFARLTRAQIARGARQRPAGSSGPSRARPAGTEPSKPRPSASETPKPRPGAPSAPDGRPSKAAAERSSAAAQVRSRRPATDAVARIRQRARLRQQMAGKMRREADRRKVRAESGRSGREAPGRPPALRRSWMSADSGPGRRSDDDPSDSERSERRPAGSDAPARPKVALASRSKSKFWFWVEEPVPRSDDDEPPAAERTASPRTLRDGRRVQPLESSSSSSEESEEEEEAPPAGRTLRDGTVLPPAESDSDRTPPAEQKTPGGRTAGRPAAKKPSKTPEPASKQAREEARKDESSSEEERAPPRGRERRGWRQGRRPGSAAAGRDRTPVPAAARGRRRARRPAGSSSSESETETSRSTTREASRQRTAQAKAKTRQPDSKVPKDSPGPVKQSGAESKPAVKKNGTPASRRNNVSSDESSKKEKVHPPKRAVSSQRKKPVSSSEDESEGKSNQKEKPKTARDVRRRTDPGSVKGESPKPSSAKKRPNGRAAVPAASHSELEPRDGKPGRSKPAESEGSSSESSRAPPPRRAPRSGSARAPPPPRRSPSSSSEEEPAARRPLRAGAGTGRRRSWETPPPPPPADAASSDSEQSGRVTRSRRPESLPIAGAVRKRAFVPGRRGWEDSSSGTEERPASRRRAPAQTSSSEERASPPPPPSADKPRRTLRKRSEAFFSYDIIDTDTDDDLISVIRPRARQPARPSDAERSTPNAAPAVSSTAGSSVPRAASAERRPTVERREASSTAVEAGAGTATPPPGAKSGLKRESSVTRHSTDRESSDRTQKKRPRPSSPSSSARHTPTKKKSASSKSTDGSFLSKLKESAQRRISRLTQRKGGAARSGGSPADSRPAMGVYEFDSDENLSSLTSLRQSSDAVKTVSEATSTSEDKPPAAPERSTCTIAIQVNMDEEVPPADVSSGTQTQAAAAQQTDCSVQSQTEEPAAAAVESSAGGLSPQPSRGGSGVPQRPPSGGQGRPGPPEGAAEGSAQSPAQRRDPPSESPAVSQPPVQAAVTAPSQLQPTQTAAESSVQPATQTPAQSVTHTPVQSLTQPPVQSGAQRPVQPATQATLQPAVQPITQPLVHSLAQPPVHSLAAPLAQRASQPLAASAVSQPLLAAAPRLIMPVSLLRPPYPVGGGEVGGRPLQLVSVTAPRCSVQPPPGLVQHQLQPPQPQPTAAPQPRFQQVQYQLGAAGLFAAGSLASGSYGAGQYPLLQTPPAGKRPLAPATWSAGAASSAPAPADRLAPIKPVHPHGGAVADWRRSADAASSAAARFASRVPPPGLIRLPASSAAAPPLHYPLPYSGPLLAGASPFAPRLALLGASQLHGTGVAVLSAPPARLEPPPPPLPLPRVPTPLTSPVDSKAAVRAQLRQAAAFAPAPAAAGRADGGAGSPADVKVPLPVVPPAPGRIPVPPVPMAPSRDRSVPGRSAAGAAGPLGPSPWSPAHSARSLAVTTRPTSAPTVTSCTAATAPSSRPASATPSRSANVVSPATARSLAAAAGAPAHPLPVPPASRALPVPGSAVPPRVPPPAPVSAPAPAPSVSVPAHRPPQAAVPVQPPVPAALARVSAPAPIPGAAQTSALAAPPRTPARPAATPEKPGIGTVPTGPLPPVSEVRAQPSFPSQKVSAAPGVTAAPSPAVVPSLTSSSGATSTAAAVETTGSGKTENRPQKRPAEKTPSSKTAPSAKKAASVSAATASPATSTSSETPSTPAASKPTPKPSSKSSDRPTPVPKPSPKSSPAGRPPTSAARGKKKAGDEAASSSSDAERLSAASPMSPAARGRRRFDREEDSGRESTPQSRRSSQSPAPAKRARKVSTMELGVLQEVPVFRPTEKEFSDPLRYIEKIRPEAEQFGLCRVVPPPGFKPECRVDDDMRFVAYNHYVHKVFRRWGPNFRELLAIRRYLEQQQIDMDDLPLVGGMEIDLPGLYHTVQRLGGLNDVIAGRRWPAVADLIHMPKCAQDRAVKLEQIYLKYLVGYTMLTEDERKRLRTEVETDWHRREQQARCRQLQTDDEDEQDSDEDDDDAAECIVKGKTVSLGAFYRVARNTASLLFKQSDPKPELVEDEYWKVVNERDRHICVYSGSVDCGAQSYGFVCDKKSQTSRLAWNLKVLSNNPGSILRSMGQVMGVTVPTVHMSMAFTTGCWYSDPHSLPWIEYLHTGASKVWYSVPASGGEALRRELTELMPGYLRQHPVWLPSDTAMVPPDLLADRGVPVARAVQQPGEFVVSFPRAFTASVGTGYTLSESVFFATPDWLASATDVYDKLKLSGEPGVFSLDRLVLGVCSDPRASLEALARCQPLLLDLQRQQHEQQQRLQQLGITDPVKISAKKGGRSRKSAALEEDDKECDVCRRTLYSAMVDNPSESVVYCLEDAAELLRKPGSKLEGLKLQLMYSQSDFEELIHQVDERIAELGSKQSSAKKKQKKSAA